MMSVIQQPSFMMSVTSTREYVRRLSPLFSRGVQLSIGEKTFSALPLSELHAYILPVT